METAVGNTKEAKARTAGDISLRQLEAVYDGILYAIRHGQLKMWDLRKPMERINRELQALADAGIGFGDEPK